MIASVTYNTSGSAGPFTITFPYLTQGDIDVYLDGVLNTAWTIASTTQLTLNTAPSATKIEIRRSTQVAPYVDFTAPGPIPPENLDTATLQSIYIAQEAQDAADKSLALDVTGVFWDAESKQIKNLATPTAANDAVTRAYADAITTGAGNLPTIVNPGDDGKFLKANAGAASWQTVVVTAAGISDSTAAGRAVITAASNAAILSQIGAAAASHTHAAADITSGTINTARLGSGTADNTTFLRGDSTWATVVSGSKPSFCLTPEAAIFPASNFPQLVKNVGTNQIDFTLDFDQTTGESCYFRFKIPVGVTFTGAEAEIASRQAAAITGTLGWIVTTLARGDAEAFDTAGNADTVTASTVKGTAGQLLLQTKTLTVTGWSAGDVILVKVTRDVASDTVAEDGKLMALVIRLT